MLGPVSERLGSGGAGSDRPLPFREKIPMPLTFRSRSQRPWGARFVVALSPRCVLTVACRLLIL